MSTTTPFPLLKEVSRSFYLTLRVLPGAVRSQIGLAYLLAHAADTIADTGVLPLDQRLQALDLFRERILGLSRESLNFLDLVEHQASPAERTLLERSEELLTVLNQYPQEDRNRIRNVLRTIIGGQELDLQRFAGASKDHLVALRNDAELDDYTYRVAGCVGEFWTRMCCVHLFKVKEDAEVVLLRNGIRFGKGLQLVNILRDIPADLAQGRCYVPLDLLAETGLTPADLLNPANTPRFRQVYQTLLDRAYAHLEAGWIYTLSLPRGNMRVRLACAWPLLIGVRTIAALHTGNVLDPSQRIKIKRPEVKSIILRSLLLYPIRPAWNKQFLRAAEPFKPL